MKIDHLLHADCPWLSVIVATPSDAYDAAWALRVGHGLVASLVLRGKKMRTFAAVYDEIGATLQFPPYFGENGNALDECITDLEWLPADAYVLTILDAVCVLDKEDLRENQIFWENLRDAAREWGQVKGGSFPRSAKLFRVVAQCTAEEEARLRERLPVV
jgi:Barstar (barnase inhibitor)